MTRPERSTSPEEQALIAWLLADLPESRRQSYLDQLPGLRVTFHCECGCPTVEFGNHPQPRSPTILAEAYGAAPEGIELDAILWETAGELSVLEFVAHDDRADFSVPAPAVMTRLRVQRS